MEVAWVTVYDAEELSALGGRGHYQSHSLRDESININYIGSLKIPRYYQPIIRFKSKIYNNTKYKNYIPHRTYDPLMESFVLKSYANQISQRLSDLKNVDIVFSGICQYLQPISFLDCKQPIVTWTDAPLISSLDFYPGMGRNEVAPECLKNGLVNERASIDRASLAIYGSEWAAQTAISQYKLEPSKVKVVPLGPNIPSKYDSVDIQTVIDARPSDCCKLLFNGMDWQRKGGNVATEIAYQLNQSGLKTELVVVGCSPQIEPRLSPYVKKLGYISSSSPNGIKQLQKLFTESHLLLLPTQADACPHVVAEASSFGVPSLTTDVGGLPTLVQDDLNGKKFSTASKIDDYCNYIANLFSDYRRYKELAYSSFHEYETRLSWSASGRVIKELIGSIVALLIIAINLKLFGINSIPFHIKKRKVVVIPETMLINNSSVNWI